MECSGHALHPLVHATATLQVAPTQAMRLHHVGMLQMGAMSQLQTRSREGVPQRPVIVQISAFWPVTAHDCMEVVPVPAPLGLPFCVALITHSVQCTLCNVWVVISTSRFLPSFGGGLEGQGL